MKSTTMQRLNSYLPKGTPPWVLPVAGVGLAAGVAYLIFKKAPPQAAADMPLDSSLSPDQKLAVSYAILHEKNPGNEAEFALMMTPDFPLSAAALGSRAKELGSNSPTAGGTSGGGNLTTTGGVFTGLTPAFKIAAPQVQSPPQAVHVVVTKKPTTGPGTDRLVEGQPLKKGEYLINTPRSAVLILQPDGNMVLYRVSDKAVLWATNTDGQPTYYASPEKGNFVLRKTDGTVAWTSAWDADWKYGNGTVILQPDGDLVMQSGTTNTWNTYTYGLRPQSDNKKTGWRPLHTFDVPAKGIVDAAHLIPGVDWLGEQLKDFANTTAGHWVLFVMASAMYPYTSGAWSLGAGAYGTPIMVSLGPQIGSLAFALPGIAKGDPFVSSWFIEFVNRVMATIAILSGGALSAAAAAAGALVASQVSKEMMDQIQPAINKVLNDPTVKQLIASGADLNTVAKATGIPNLRQDVLQAAKDYAQGVVSSFAHDVIKGFSLGGITIPDIPATAGLLFDPKTGALIGFQDAQGFKDTRTPQQKAVDAAREASAQAQGAQMIQALKMVAEEKRRNPNWNVDMPHTFDWSKGIPAIDPEIAIRQDVFAKIAAAAKPGSTPAQQAIAVAAKKSRREQLVTKYVALSHLR